MRVSGRRGRPRLRPQPAPGPRRRGYR